MATEHNSLKTFSQFRTNRQKNPQLISSKTCTTSPFMVNSVKFNWRSLSVLHQKQPSKFAPVWTFFPINSQKINHRKDSSCQDTIDCSDEDLTLNSISNASTEMFTGNELWSFETVLHTPTTFSGDWRVALLDESEEKLRTKFSFRRSCQGGNWHCRKWAKLF